MMPLLDTLRWLIILHIFIYIYICIPTIYAHCLPAYLWPIEYTLTNGHTMDTRWRNERNDGHNNNTTQNLNLCCYYWPKLCVPSKTIRYYHISSNHRQSNGMPMNSILFFSFVCPSLMDNGYLAARALQLLSNYPSPSRATWYWRLTTGDWRLENYHYHHTLHWFGFFSLDCGCLALELLQTASTTWKMLQKSISACETWLYHHRQQQFTLPLLLLLILLPCAPSTCQLSQLTELINLTLSYPPIIILCVTWPPPNLTH